MRLATTPPQNHWWNVTLSVDVRALTTGRMRWDGKSFNLTFDFLEHALLARTDDGASSSFGLHDGLSVSEFHERLFELLGSLGIDVTIRPEPFGVPMTTPFPEDTEHTAYDVLFVERYWRALEWVDWVFREFAGWSCAKTSPVHLFWHSLDLAVTRFSGKRAPALPNADGVTREAYSHEAISFGFWPGDAKGRRRASTRTPPRSRKA